MTSADLRIDGKSLIKEDGGANKVCDQAIRYSRYANQPMPHERIWTLPLD